MRGGTTSWPVPEQASVSGRANRTHCPTRAIRCLYCAGNAPFKELRPGFVFLSSSYKSPLAKRTEMDAACGSMMWGGRGGEDDGEEKGIMRFLWRWVSLPHSYIHACEIAHIDEHILAYVQMLTYRCFHRHTYAFIH